MPKLVGRRSDEVAVVMCRKKMALTKNNADTFYENINVNFKRIERSGAWRGCELRNRLFSVKDKISCEM